MADEEPKFSFGLKASSFKESQLVPGPGTYDPAMTLAKEKAPGYRVGTEPRHSLGGNSQNPGPGQYFDAKKDALNKIGTSFSKAERIGKMGPSSTPGPGNYEVLLSKKSSGKTMGARFSANPSHLAVGPGAYDPKLDWSRPHASSYTMRIRTGEMYEANRNPGPGQYELKFSQTTPAWR